MGQLGRHIGQPAHPGGPHLATAEVANPAGPVVRIFGIHAVAAALANPERRLRRLYLTDNAEHRLRDARRQRGVTAERVHSKDLDRRLGAGSVHQGALLEAEPLPDRTLEELCARAGQGRPLVVLDQVISPQNVGAILRSAAVFGAAGLIMTRRNSPTLAGVLAKSASGAVEHVPVALVTNLARALQSIAELGLRLIGLDGDADELIEDAEAAGPVALVLGAEGKGLRRLTREGCDALVRIGARGAITSLNVSNAAAIALYVVTTERRSADT